MKFKRTMHFSKTTLSCFICSITLTLMSCGKSNSARSTNSTSPVYYNSFTYTITDTTGAKYTFTDTTTYSINKYGDTSFLINGHNTSVSGQQFPAAYISQPSTPNNASSNLRFIFFDVGSGTSVTNQITFYLPYYQYNLKRDSLFGSSPLVVLINGSTYDADHQYDTRALYSINISTNITDSSAGFVSGTFKILAKNSTNKPIQVNGSFNHVLNNFMLH